MQRPQIYVFGVQMGMRKGQKAGGESAQGLESLSLVTLRWWVPAGWHQAKV